jgi:predicted amidohydrolase YtcJ
MKRVPEVENSDVRPHLILAGGRIFPGRAGRPWPGAVAVAGERICAVGGSQEIEALAGRETRVVDLRGRLVVPGFNDAHIHLQAGGLAMLRADLIAGRSLEEYRKIVEDAAKKKVPGEWILGRGWDEAYLGWTRPTAALLDPVAPRNPVLLKRVDGHAAWVNTRVLTMAGIGPETPDPPGGRILREPSTGAPTGVLLEGAMDLVDELVPETTSAEKLRGLRLALQEALRYGITSIQEHEADRVLYEELLQRGELPLRASLWYDLGESIEALREEKRHLDGLRSSRLRFGLVKGFADGTLGSKTALLTEPYLDEPENCGVEVLPEAVLAGRICEADAAGFQVAVHAIGDEGCRRVLASFALARERNGPRQSRHRVEHVQLFPPHAQKWFAELGVVASVQPVHLLTDLLHIPFRLGGERCRRAYAWRSLRKAHVSLAFGTDFPVEPLNPMLGLFAAIVRERLDGGGRGVASPAERLSLEEALEAYTYGGAFASFAEEEKGLLEPGKLADMAVLSEDLSGIDPHRLPEIRVDLTVVGGEVVYEAE